jgi:cytosine deaminase
VVRRGRVISRTPERVSTLSLEDRPATLDPADYAPSARGPAAP